MAGAGDGTGGTMTSWIDGERLAMTAELLGRDGHDQLLRLFLVELHAIGPSLSAAFAGDDQVAIGRAAHALKGAAAGVGADRLVAALDHVERLAARTGADADAIDAVAACARSTADAVAARLGEGAASR